MKISASFGLLVFLCPIMAFSQSSQDKELANEVKSLFTRSCYGCHGQSGTPPKAGLNVLNYDQLINDKLVIAGASAFSQLFNYIDEGEMPPVGEKFPNGELPQKLSKDEVAKVEKWIDDGAEPWDEDDNNQDFITYRKLLELINKDVQALSSVEAAQIRYLSFAHLANQGLSSAEIDRIKKATVKLLNSFSTRPNIHLPSFIDDTQLLMKVDLDKINWYPQTWRRLERVYPFQKNQTSTLEKNILKKMVTAQPFLAADWFVATASRPPLYHEIVYTDQFNLGGSGKDILFRVEEELGLDRIKNIVSGNTVRGGFNSSGVSVNNRIIERHDIGDYPGYYWLSYDFAGNSADPQLRENIFNFPLGPAEAFPNDDSTFLHAGGEVIFSLPNGLQAYLLTDAQGNRLDKAPTNIVTDPIRPDNAVENGLSCFRCHDKGIILKRDTIRDFLDINQDLYIENYVVLKETYKGNDIFYEKQKEDLNNYLQSLDALKVSVKEQEPISVSALEFEKDMDLTTVAGELYTTTPDLLAMIANSQILKAIIGPASVSGGRIKRDYFLENYKTLEKEINYSSGEK